MMRSLWLALSLTFAFTFHLSLMAQLCCNDVCLEFIVLGVISHVDVLVMAFNAVFARLVGMLRDPLLLVSDAFGVVGLWCSVTAP